MARGKTLEKVIIGDEVYMASSAPIQPYERMAARHFYAAYVLRTAGGRSWSRIHCPHKHESPDLAENCAVGLIVDMIMMGWENWKAMMEAETEIGIWTYEHEDVDDR